MACGLPVVASDKCISALEMIKDGVNGYIVPAENDETLANKIQLALSLNAYQTCIDTARNNGKNSFKIFPKMRIESYIFCGYSYLLYGHR